MHIHILSICGKFMSGLAIIAKQMGFHVTGSDQNLFEPMYSHLASHGITCATNYDINALTPRPDCVVIGNALSRGQAIVEYILNQNIPYFSGPEWLFENVLKDKHVLAVSGTHGKTTTTAMLAWILESAGLNPGFLIGGQPKNFNDAARYTDSNFFVIEADEYDSAFFDKRSKFMHYHPRTLIINNIEFDHADIFKSLDDIKTTFHHLVRTVPQNGQIIIPKNDLNVNEVIDKGHWTPLVTFDRQDADWFADHIVKDGSQFEVVFQQENQGTIKWPLLGQHNVLNALASLAAAKHANVATKQAIAALNQFQGVERRLELKGIAKGVRVYDDFAHHPTAIATTIAGLRAHVGKQRIVAVLEFGSHTMRTGVHFDHLKTVFTDADLVFLLRPKSDHWNIEELKKHIEKPVFIHETVSEMINDLKAHSQLDDHVLIMSNLSFDGAHEKLLGLLANE